MKPFLLAIVLLLVGVPDGWGALPVIPEPHHIIFATKTAYGISRSTSFPPVPGYFHGLDSADWVCTRNAAAAGFIPGWDGYDVIWKALLWTAEIDAADRISIEGPVYNTNGDLIAADAAEFWSENHQNPVGYNEYGELIPIENRDCWTGKPYIDLTQHSCGCWDDPDLRGWLGDSTKNYR